jgi:hypothetical protein
MKRLCYMPLTAACHLVMQFSSSRNGVVTGRRYSAGVAKEKEREDNDAT